MDAGLTLRPRLHRLVPTHFPPKHMRSNLPHRPFPLIHRPIAPIQISLLVDEYHSVLELRRGDAVELRGGLPYTEEMVWIGGPVE